MTSEVSPVVACSQCKRPAPVELDGTVVGDTDWAAWNVLDDGESVICSDCVTFEQLTKMADFGSSHNKEES